MKKWDKLPRRMQNEEVRYYYDILCKKQISLRLKRIFDICASFVLILILFPVMIILGAMIKKDSKGPVFYRQVRVTAYGKKFKIFKFRTMVQDADKIGSQVTTKSDTRITRVGHMLRKTRLDELPQLFNVLIGDMSFVGTRPEVPKYVGNYNNKMLATLLLPAGITSRTSIEYKDEDMLLADADNVDEIYIKEVLPAKMEYNLRELEKFNFGRDIRTMFLTIFAVLR